MNNDELNVFHNYQNQPIRYCM